MRETTEAENEAGAGECTSQYGGNQCELKAGHTVPHLHWIEGYGDLTWTDEQAQAEHQKTVDYWAERGVVWPPASEQPVRVHAWYTSGDGCDVASGDEYQFGYTVHCRAPDPAAAEHIARAANVSEIISFVSRASPQQTEILATLCGFMVQCGSDPAVFRIDETGVSCQARGKRSRLRGVPAS